MPNKVIIDVTENAEPVNEMDKRGACKEVEVGQKWKYPDDVGGLCPFALNAMMPSLIIFQFGGLHPQSKRLGDHDKVVETCTDPFRRVVFTMTRIRE